MSAIIIVDDLVKVYDKNVKAVSGISFTVEEGEVFGLLGPNGAGKSTTISMMNTLLDITSGSITVDGLPLKGNENKIREKMGLVPQLLTSDEELTGRENMELHAALFDLPKSEAKERINELLKITDLEEAANRKVETYSGGMRKRLNLAEGLIHSPKILVLDEPTLGLDVQTRATIWEYIKDMKERKHMTVILTTHYLEEADSLCDHIAIVDKGKIVATGTPEELKSSLGGDRIEIESDDSDIYDVLNGMKNIKSVDRKENVYSVLTENGENTMKDILSAVAENKILLNSIVLKKPTLDDAFLKFTGKSIRDENSAKFDRRVYNVQNRRRN